MLEKLLTHKNLREDINFRDLVVKEATEPQNVEVFLKLSASVMTFLSLMLLKLIIGFLDVMDKVIRVSE